MLFIGSLDLQGNVCNQRCLSVCLFPVCFLSVSCLSVFFLSVCFLSVRNADISETIIARAAKFGMLILHIKSANFVDGIFKRCLVLKISNLKVFGELVIFGESELISAE